MSANTRCQLRATRPPPGTSDHEAGIAFDFDSNGLARQGISVAEIRQLAGQFGFVPLPSGKDAVHLQMNVFRRGTDQFFNLIKENQADFVFLQIFNSEYPF
jgi:hypothetical protein